jgi:hypothetical protein
VSAAAHLQSVSVTGQRPSAAAQRLSRSHRGTAWPSAASSVPAKGVGRRRDPIDWKLAELSKLVPVAIIAETLGYHPATIDRHAVDAAATYAEYIAAVGQAANR